MSDRKKYIELFDYLSTPKPPQEAVGVLAFGRKDLLIARKVVDLSRNMFAKYVVITGGAGKDSGDLEIPEAEYLAHGVEDITHETGTQLPPVYTETQATNGGENVRYSLCLMRRLQLPYNLGLTVVAHATSSRRLTAILEHEIARRGEAIAPLYSTPSDYAFDPENPIDQKEAVAEMLRLVEWPDKGWLLPQPDLPQDLVEFARNISTDK